MVNAFNASTWQAEAGGSLRFRPVWLVGLQSKFRTVRNAQRLSWKTKQKTLYFIGFVPSQKCCHLASLSSLAGSVLGLILKNSAIHLERCQCSCAILNCGSEKHGCAWDFCNYLIVNWLELHCFASTFWTRSWYRCLTLIVELLLSQVGGEWWRCAVVSTRVGVSDLKMVTLLLQLPHNV